MINSQNDKNPSPIKIKRVGDTLQAYDYLTKSYQKLRLAGFNDTSATEFSYKFNDTINTLSNLDNPFLNGVMDKSIGQLRSDNTAYQPLKMNFKRQYIPTAGVTVMNQGSNQESIIADSSETYEDNVLYFLPIRDLNITVTSIPTVNIAYANTLTSEQQGTYFAVVEKSDGSIGNTGVVTAIIAHNIASYNVTANPTVTISGGGLGAAVTIPATKFRIRKRAIRSINIENKGYGYKVTSQNKGFAHYVGQKEKYYYSMFDGSNKDSSNTVEPTILARIRTQSMVIQQSGTGNFDFYSNSSQGFLTKERNELFDCWIFDGGEYMPENAMIDKGVRSTRFDCTNSYSGYIDGTGYAYDFDGFNGYEFTNKLVRSEVKTYTSEQYQYSYEHAKKYGIYTLYNFWYTFAPWNQGGYAANAQERIMEARRSRTEFKTKVMNELIKLRQATGDDQIMILLGNESNLNYMLEGYDWASYSANYSQNVFWADPANPTDLQKNVEAMVSYFNDFAGEIKSEFGDKFILGIGLQYADAGHCVQVETAVNLGLTSNFDFLGNNYYGNGTTTAPWINKAGLNVFTRYTTNVTAANRLPMIVTEAGSPSFIYSDNTGANQTVYETQQGDIMKNMLSVINTYSHVNGVALFGFWNQPNRGYETLLANYDGFNFPTIAPIVNTHFNEKDMGVINFPLYFPNVASAGYNNTYTDIPTPSEMNTYKKPAFTAIKAEIAANHTNLTKIL